MNGFSIFGIWAALSAFRLLIYMNMNEKLILIIDTGYWRSLVSGKPVYI
jgi:hypothetical protein